MTEIIMFMMSYDHAVVIDHSHLFQARSKLVTARAKLQEDIRLKVGLMTMVR